MERRHAGVRGDVLERAVVLIDEERVVRAEARAGEVQVGPAVVVDVAQGNAGAERGDVGGDAIELGVERRGVVDEVDARRARVFTQVNRLDGGGPAASAAGPRA